jgi:hypothetical protein
VVELYHFSFIVPFLALTHGWSEFRTFLPLADRGRYLRSKQITFRPDSVRQGENCPPSWKKMEGRSTVFGASLVGGSWRRPVGSNAGESRASLAMA